MFLRILFLSLVLVAFSCSKKVDPEGILRSYVKTRFEKRLVPKSELLPYLTGDFHSKIEAMDEEEFKSFTNLKDLVYKDLKIILKNCTEDICQLTYLLRYKKFEGGPEKHSVEVKNVARLVKVEDRWKIDDVLSVKTYIESKKEITP